MTTTAAGDVAVARLNKATEAFEKIITGASNQVVDVPGYGNQPTLAARVDERLDETTATAAAEANRSRDEADRATTQASAAANSVVLANAEFNKAKTQADRAQSEADRASQISGLDTVADAIGLATLPFPDVWIPFTDSLRMFAGYGREVKVGDDVIARYVNFERTTNAWYFDKMGNLRLAAVNEPRFEAEGLLIEGASTNLHVFSWFDGTYRSNQMAYNVNYSAITDPKFSFTVGRFSRDASVATHSVVNRGVMAAAGVYCASALIKDGGAGSAEIWLRDQISGVNYSKVTINLITGQAVISQGGSLTECRGGAINKGDGWWLVWASGIISADTTMQNQVYVKSSAGEAGSDADAILCAFMQLEALPFPSSYIHSTGAAATRAVDKCWMPIDRNSPVNSDITMAVEYDMVGGAIGDGQAGSSAWRSICGFYTAGAGFYNWLLVRSDDLKLSYYWGLEAERAIVNTNGKGVVVGRVKLGLISIFNSGIKGTDKQGSKNQNHNQSIFSFGNIAIGSGASSAIGDRELYGHLKNFRIWHSARTDAQCVAIR